MGPVLGTILEKYRTTNPRLERVEQYLNGHHAPAYMPEEAAAEFGVFRERSVKNFLPLVVDAVASNLYVDGLRAAGGGDNFPVWESWDLNGMVEAQTAVHRDALAFGEAYVRVLPGNSGPEIEPLSPLSVTALFKRTNDPYPIAAAVHGTTFSEGKRYSTIDLYDDAYVFRLVSKEEGDASGASDFVVVEQLKHGLSHCPIIRFRNMASTSPDVPSLGEVEPLIPIQDNLNNIELSTAIAIQYGAHRQKWVAGVNPPKDGQYDVDLFGRIKKKSAVVFSAARLLIFPDKDTKTGQFDATDIGPYLDAYNNTVKHLAAIGALPPHYLSGDMINLSAEALAAAQESLQRKVDDRKRAFGGAWQRVFQTVAELMGETLPADAELVWRDTAPRSFAATVDALGKMVSAMGVPAEAAWAMVPGMTPAQLAEWRLLAERMDPATKMAHALAKSVLPPEVEPVAA
ncbi:phage portal protein [Streptomyces sp. NPDC005790]|uniref:phage portal protein n=1 Tax=Streptomyces sp. NPDC005790 TaxID=3154777 RepID=UPI0033F9776E